MYIGEEIGEANGINIQHNTDQLPKAKVYTAS